MGTAEKNLYKAYQKMLKEKGIKQIEYERETTRKTARDYKGSKVCENTYFIEGYHQPEKDLALTWEDMRELYIIFTEVNTEIVLCKTDIKPETLGYYEEVLKRFKKRKENDIKRH